MSHDNEGPREGQENSTPFPEKPEESSPKPVTALVGTGDPFLDELNRLSEGCFPQFSGTQKSLLTNPFRTRIVSD